jgi:hypothetical protein
MEVYAGDIAPVSLPGGGGQAWSPSAQAAAAIATLTHARIAGIGNPLGMEVCVTDADREINGELDVAFSSPEEFGRVALAWLTDGMQALAGDVSDEILGGPPLQPYWTEGVSEDDPRFGVGEPPLWGEVRIVYPSRSGGYYSKPYSQRSLKRLESLAPALRSADVYVHRSEDGCYLQVKREGEDSGHARLMVMLGKDAGGAAGDLRIAFMRDFAGRHVASFGHVSPVSVGLPGETQLELALNRQTWTSLAEWDRYLRGYSWVTVAPAVLAGRLGGVGALRASGAFCEVGELAGGSVWLQATPRWSDYGQQQVDRVFEVLAPVLPSGMPDSYWVDQWAGFGMPEVRVPYVVSIRDAAEFHRSGT